MGLFRCRDLLELNSDASIKNQTIFKLNKATESAAKIIELLCRDKNVKIKVTYDNDSLANAKFFGDVTKYQQVFINVLANAARSNPPNSLVDV